MDTLANENFSTPPFDKGEALDAITLFAGLAMRSNTLYHFVSLAPHCVWSYVEKVQIKRRWTHHEFRVTLLIPFPPSCYSSSSYHSHSAFKRVFLQRQQTTTTTTSVTITTTTTTTTTTASSPSRMSADEFRFDAADVEMEEIDVEEATSGVNRRLHTRSEAVFVADASTLTSPPEPSGHLPEAVEEAEAEVAAAIDAPPSMADLALEDGEGAALSSDSDLEENPPPKGESSVERRKKRAREHSHIRRQKRRLQKQEAKAAGTPPPAPFNVLKSVVVSVS